MDVIATSKAEANSELKSLRKKRGFEGHNQANPTLVSFLDEALNLSVPPRLTSARKEFLNELLKSYRY
jgi:hypothetical protein